MRVLVTGGNGAVGRDLVPALLARGHAVTVLDRQLGALAPLTAPRLTLVEGAVEDPAALARALAGAQAVVHLAWSFSDDPRTLLEQDLRGHQLLLDACRAGGVEQLVYASSAIVYGRPVRLPVDEDHPLLALEARKPAYALAKEAAEKLTLLAARSGGPAATILRFWWAFGAEIGGRHLRDLLRAAAGGRRLTVPAECGGSFLALDELASAVDAALAAPPVGGEVLNLASAYLGWDEIARMAASATRAGVAVDVVSRANFDGPAFLAETWHLDDRRARERLRLAPVDPVAVRAALARAVAASWRRLAPTLVAGGTS
jgi:UDP-glucose 4-epimerase